MKKGFYVYKHLNLEGEVIYVGRTVNMRQRQREHRNHAIHKQLINSVIYAEVPNRTCMVIYELYYINKLDPKYNIADSRRDNVTTLNLKDLVFKKYKQEVGKRIERKEKQYKVIKELIKQQTPLALTCTPNEILYNNEIDDTTKLLMSQIVCLYARDGYVYINNETLGNHMHCSASNISKKIKVLKNKGLIETEEIMDRETYKRIIKVCGLKNFMQEIKRSF